MRPAKLSARTATGTAQARPTPGARARSMTRSVSGAKVMLESLVTITSCAATASGPDSVSSLGLVAPMPADRSTRAGTGLSATSRRMIDSAGESSSDRADDDLVGRSLLDEGRSLGALEGRIDELDRQKQRDRGHRIRAGPVAKDARLQQCAEKRGREGDHPGQPPESGDTGEEEFDAHDRVSALSRTYRFQRTEAVRDPRNASWRGKRASPFEGLPGLGFDTNRNKR